MVYAKSIDFLINVDGNPNKMLKHRKLAKGDQFYISRRQGENFKIGEKYKGFVNLMVIEIIYAPKKRWRFWEKRKVIGYVVRCIKD